MLISLEKIQAIFAGLPEQEEIALSGECCICGCKTTVQISKTSGGYGFLGGVLNESKNGQRPIKCARCHRRRIELGQYEARAGAGRASAARL